MIVEFSGSSARQLIDGTGANQIPAGARAPVAPPLELPLGINIINHAAGDSVRLEPNWQENSRYKTGSDRTVNGKLVFSTKKLD